jgi:transmembrane sensor
MSGRVYDFPDRRLIEEEAAAWLVRLDDDERLTADERDALREWLGRSPVHREELGAIAGLWGRMNVLTELAVPLGKPDGGGAHPTVARAALLQRSALPRLGIAAAAVMLVVAALVVSRVGDDPPAVSQGLYATAVGQQQTILLADGSAIQLNTNSQAQVAYDDRHRDIRLLQGEAYFTVAREGRRPFRVYAGSGRVEAVGTAFSVYLKDNDINVTVAQGRVALAALDPATASPPPATGADTKGATGDQRYDRALGTLAAGQRTTIRALIISEDAVTRSVVEPIETVEPAELARLLSWRRGLLIFAGDPLEHVVAEISRYSPVTVEIVDPELKAIRIGGQFRVGDVEAMLSALEANFHMRVIRLPNNHVQIAAAED